MYLEIPRYLVVVHFIPPKLRPSNSTHFHPKKSTYPGPPILLEINSDPINYELGPETIKSWLCADVDGMWQQYMRFGGDFTKLVLMSEQAEAGKRG